MRLPLPSWLTTLKDGLVELFYPNTCWVCNRFIPECKESACPQCFAALTSDPGSACPRCASSVGPFVDLADGCARCRLENYVFEGALRMGPYEGLLRDMVLRLKNSRTETLAEIIGNLWAEQLAPRLQALAPQVVVPVPLHWTRRYWERGFNQSEILARCLARRLQIYCDPYCLRRLRRTPRQTQQSSPTARRDNVRGAFRARPGHALKDKTVLLVDDVLTTGATANEAARALKVLQPSRIIVAVLAHSKM
jgi:ComF family protein